MTDTEPSPATTPSEPPLRIVVTGADGKMGRELVRTIAQTPNVTLAAALVRSGHPSLGSDAGLRAGIAPQQVTISDDLDAVLEHADVVIDFTTPSVSAWHATQCAARNVALVIGTTGLGPAEQRSVDHAAAIIPVVMSPNMSIGVNVLYGLLEVCARTLGPSYDVEVLELHHREKRDAPSGTAMRMARLLADTFGRDLDASLRHGRHGNVGARSREEIGMAALRGGDVIGEHTAYFVGMGERIELTHRAWSRETFARGAVRAAIWLCDRDPGLYDMRDVLGLRE